MASTTTTCPTVKATTACPTTGYRFEPTGTYNPMTMPSNWYNSTSFDAAPFFPPTKTYSSIFNKDTTTMPSPMVNMPPMMMPTTPVPSTTMPPMTPVMTPVMTPFMTPVSPMTPMTTYPVPTTMPSWCYSPMTTPFDLPTTFPMTYPTVNPMMMMMMTPNTPFCMPWETPMTMPSFFGMPTTSTYPMMPSTAELCSVGFRPCNAVEMYCLTHPIRVCDREGNRILCLNFDLRGYKPEEVTVTLNKAERCIIVEASHEVKEGKEHHVMRKFCRKFVLPESLAKIDLAKCEIKSCLTTEGCLCIEMPLPKLTIEEIAKCPIMSKDYTSAPFGLLSCDYTNTTPIACKIN